MCECIERESEKLRTKCEANGREFQYIEILEGITANRPVIRYYYIQLKTMRSKSIRVMSDFLVAEFCPFCGERYKTK